MGKETDPNLSDKQKEVLFACGTEPAFSGSLLNEKRTGDFICANCKSKLFDSSTKYNSGSGWPSFDSAIEGAVHMRDDYSHSMTRTEVICANCSAHLGHVFDDGPRETTGKRYCINSLAMKFIQKDVEGMRRD